MGSMNMMGDGLLARRTGLPLLALSLMLAGIASGASWEATTVQAAKVRRGPNIDGVLDEACWRGLKRLTGFSTTVDNWPAQVQTRVYTLYDDEALYVAFDCEEPNPGGMKMESKQETAIRDVFAKKDDLVDVFLVPEEGERYQFAVTAAGVKFDKYSGPKKDLRYKYGKDCTAATKIGEKNWVCEMRLPFKALRIGPQMGRTWRMNFCRSRVQGEESSSWTETSGNWKNENAYGYLKGIIIGEEYLVKKPPLRVMDVSLSEFRCGRQRVEH